jgi:hypothetical protein
MHAVRDEAVFQSNESIAAASRMRKKWIQRGFPGRLRFRSEPSGKPTGLE